MKQLKTFDKATKYDYYVDIEARQFFADHKGALIKVNPMYDAHRVAFYPIRLHDNSIEHILASVLFKKPKIEKKRIVAPKDSTEATEIRREKRNAYMREYMADYKKKYNTEMMKHNTQTHMLENKQNLEILPIQWFMDRVFKRVYRDKSPCKCDDCERNLIFGWEIMDEQDAIRLYNEQIKYKVRFYEEQGKW